MNKQDIGLIGLSVMGSNLALNMADKGYKVAIFNRTTTVIDEVLEKYKHGNLFGAYSLKQLVDSLERPRKIIMMIKSGEPVDMLIEQILPYLDEGDILIDGGNSYFKDTQRRAKYLKEKGIKFLGVGISGGEEGARFGPAIMPGGDFDAYEKVKCIFEDIAAKVNGEPCCNYVGENGAGHYVKMVHNGIEYADMQLISEAYMLLKHLGKFNNKELHRIFAKWNEGELESYLIKITSNIFTVKDRETNNYLLDMILDKASQKGTGKWTNMEAIDLGVDVSIITSALNGRFMSNLKEERLRASKILNGKVESSINIEKEEFIELVRRSLYLSKIACYAQGFQLLKVASKTYNWDLQYGNIARIFRGGCIIQARFLKDIISAYEENNNARNLMITKTFSKVINEYDKSLRKTISIAINQGIPVTAMSSALGYMDTYRSYNLGANLIQAQRDYFGAHTFQRIDKEGNFHYDWVNNYEK
ncbi:NADP-dependent phosphogluconate dehydrogenase [Clostridium tetani]|nr:NADP-dependent phosphogluconate dehydrogenase [Clostridium tetani]